MALNGQSLNSVTLNGDSSGETAAYVGLAISIEQQVIQRSTYEGLAISVQQSVTSGFSGLCLSIQQQVIDSTVPDFFGRNGWAPTIVIGSYVVPVEQIHGQIVITHEENSSRLASFTLIPPIGSQDPYKWQGSQVKIYIRTGTGTRCCFTGVIDLPEYALYEEKITYRCTDRRQERINSELSQYVKNVGYYSEDVFGEAKTVSDEMASRLNTIPSSLDITGEGSFLLTAWQPKSTPDFTLTAGGVLKRPQQVQLSKRSQVVNKISINVQHRYQRLHHRNQSYVWIASWASICDFIQNGYSVPTRDMIRQAANAAGWPVRGEIGFTPMFSAGFYRCGAVTVAYSTGSVTGQNTPLTNPDGSPRLDSGGNQIYQFVQTGSQDIANTICRGASWNATKRWAQTITENYTLTVQSPKSILAYGLVAQTDSVGVESEYDTADWENYTAYKNPPTGATTVPAQPATTYYINQATNRAGANNAISTIINKARTSILKSHREDRVSFEVPLWREIDLHHTVYTNDRRVQAKGKVYRFTHTMDINTCDATTVVELALFKNVGNDTPSVLSAPTIPTSGNPHVPGGIALQSHYGEDPSTAAAKKWTGHIGNRWIKVYLGGGRIDNRKTNFQESFVVDTPEIEPAARDELTLASNKTYNVSIPQDSLTITFYKTPI